jgi:ABC-type multidrug transport system ATPase subunit
MTEKYNMVKSTSDVELGLTSAKSLRFNHGGLVEATLMWRQLNKYVELGTDGSKKQILHSVSGVAKPGEMIALMGPSGSG